MRKPSLFTYALENILADSNIFHRKTCTHEIAPEKKISTPHLDFQSLAKNIQKKVPSGLQNELFDIILSSQKHTGKSYATSSLRILQGLTAAKVLG